MPAVIPGLEGYFGSKGGSGVYQNIISHIPRCKILFIPFLGHCAITRKIKRPYKLILNDKDPDVVEAWKEALLSSGFILNNGVTADIQKKQFNLDLIYLFEDEESNSMISLFCGDAIKQIDHFKNFSSICIYADPPYLKQTRRNDRNVYKYYSSVKLHKQLISIIKRMTAKIIISAYQCELYDSTNLNMYTFPAMTHAGLSEEAIYYNFDLDSVKLQDYRYLGKNFKDRERIRLKIARLVNKMNGLPTQERNALIEAITH